MNYVKTIINDIEMVSWSEGTDSQIIKMINGYYNNLLTIDDIKSVWYLGDFRDFNLTNIDPFYPMSYSGISWDDSNYAYTYEMYQKFIETHADQTVQMRIVGFEHDDLVTSINGHTKALVSLIQMGPLKSLVDVSKWDNNSRKYIIVKEMMSEHGIYDDQYLLTAEEKYLPHNFNWGESRRRQWCNNNYYMSIPIKFRKLIKKVLKKNRTGYLFNNVVNTEDYVWLPSGSEVSENETYLDEGNFYGLTNWLDYKADYDSYSIGSYHGMMLRSLISGYHDGSHDVLSSDSCVISIDQSHWYWDNYKDLRFYNNNGNGFGIVTINFELVTNITYYINSRIEVFDENEKDNISFTLTSNSISYEGKYLYHGQHASDNHPLYYLYIKDDTDGWDGHRDPYIDVTSDNTNWQLIIDLTKCQSSQISLDYVNLTRCLLKPIDFSNDYYTGANNGLWQPHDLLPGFCI